MQSNPIHPRGLSLVMADITRLDVEAIVNAANSSLLGGGGVDGAIHGAAGPELLKECRHIGGCPTGSAVITTGGNLFAPYVIHAVGPVYRRGASEAPVLLRRAYKSCLNLAENNGITSIAFPSISTGAYGYPIAEAAQVALSTVIEHITGPSRIEQVIFVLFSSRDFDVYASLLNEMTRQGT